MTAFRKTILFIVCIPLMAAGGVLLVVSVFVVPWTSTGPFYAVVVGKLFLTAFFGVFIIIPLVALWRRALWALILLSMQVGFYTFFAIASEVGGLSVGDNLHELEPRILLGGCVAAIVVTIVFYWIVAPLKRPDAT